MLLKRALDLIMALLALAVLWPLILLVALVIWVNLGAPVLYTQARPGLKGKPFRLIKFRSMTDEIGTDGQLLSDEERLPAFGRWLRSTSLDELPELWNVLRGDMSFVGPRPLLMEYMSLYSPEQARRHDVRPGLTGWAQIKGRNGLPWKERFELDIWYVDNRNLRLDLQILWRTLFKVLRREGISQDGSATMTPFRGDTSK